MNLLELLLEASPFQTHCPVCHAEPDEPCRGDDGRFHTARKLLRVAELEAVASAY